MNQSYKERLLRISDELIAEGTQVASTCFDTNVIGAPTFVEQQALHRWWGKVKSFAHQLGTAAKPWKETFTTDPKRNTLAFVKMVLGTLEATRHEIENDYLDTFTQLVQAETFADLIDQAHHLFDNGYHLAAGVIGRAVLEEHLRATCESLECTPSKQHLTINDFNQALYGIEHYSKTKMKQIDMLASIGNDAAHNKPDLDAADVKRLITDLPELIESTRA